VVQGRANVRGNLYSVVDFPAFLGGRASRSASSRAAADRATLSASAPRCWSTLARPAQPGVLAAARAAQARRVAAREYEDEAAGVEGARRAELVQDQNF
jgi:hypothetical protein